MLLILILCGATLAAWAILRGSGACELSGPVWWRMVPYAGLAFHGVALSLLLSKRFSATLPLFALTGLVVNLILTVQQLEAGAHCYLCWAHVATLAALAAMSALKFPPKFRRWQPTEKCAVLIVPICLLISGASPEHRQQLASLLNIPSKRLQEISLPIDPAHDVADVPKEWRSYIKAPAVLAFCGDCTQCRRSLIERAREKGIPFVAVFSATKENIRATLGKKSTDCYVADPEMKLAKAMNAPPIRIFAIDATYKVVWAQPARVRGYNWVGDLLEVAAARIQNKENTRETTWSHAH